jgi:indole-3-glycerol phosphate synthase
LRHDALCRNVCAVTVAQGILGRILEEKHREVAALRERTTTAALEQAAASAPQTRDFVGALRRHGAPLPRVIAEHKRASPSAGTIRGDANPAIIASDYEGAGAAALSVLTDEKFFQGRLADLTTARVRATIPTLRKDFLVDALQVLEARAAGADAVLLIVAALDDARLRELHDLALAWKMGVLVEVHDAAEAERALALGAQVIGVNHRDLRTFEMDMTLTARVRALVPADRVLVAESGIRTHADVLAMVAAGADAILVGEALMRQPSPGNALRLLLGQAASPA